MVGKTLVHYEITAQIGRGGMGEVYQAKDTKLGRDVAIKVLPEEFALDTDRVARFQREAKLLASLNHPNIAAIYGLEESEGTHFLVMELIEGDTLRDRIKSGPIPVEEALKLALQMAEALEAAHDKGVIHRDLKPANIKVTPDGKVKILDFGLAKAYVGDQENVSPMDSPTISAAATQQGVILGTAAYMSPEQARGKPVDKRADIWAFGVVLFEMLTGKSLFSGEDVTSTVAQVLEREPDFSTLPQKLHPRIQIMLERCLKKDPKDRYSGISDARVDIQEVLSDPVGVLAEPVAAVKVGAESRVFIPWISAVILVGITVGVVVWKLREPEPRQPIRYAYEIPEDQQLYQTGRGNINLALSRDGRQIIYSTTKGLFIRSMDELKATLIRGSDTDSLSLFFSPDSQWLCYFSKGDQKLKKISKFGGKPIEICDAYNVSGTFWCEDNTILYSDVIEGGGIYRVSSDSGTPELLIGGPYTRPQLLPDGESIMFIDISGGDLNLKTLVQSLKSGERKVVLENNPGGYLPTGHLVYLGEEIWFAVQFDFDKLDPIGSPFRLNLPRGEAVYSDSGTLAYVEGTLGTAAPGSTLEWVDTDGYTEQLVDAEPKKYVDSEISPDGTKVALTIDDSGNQDIYILDPDRGNMLKLTDNANIDRWPLWTQDGQRIVFLSVREEGIGIYAKAANGLGKVEKLAGWSEPYLPGPFAWVKDGNTLLSWDLNLSSRQTSISIMQMEGGLTRKPLFEDEKYNYDHPQISPDGRWLAYSSSKSGQNEVYVCSYPDVERDQKMISVSGGYGPLWSTDGQEVFYRNGQSVMACPVETDSILKPGKPRELFRGSYNYELVSSQAILPAWGFHPIEKRFLMIKPSHTSSDRSRIIIVVNWFEELKQRVSVD